MFLFNIMDVVQVPFGYLLDFLYQLTNSYGLALILFAVVVRLILVPTTAKSKKSTMKMSRLQPQIQYIQKKYANDQQKQSQAMQELYKAEGVSMGAGCLWSLVPLLIMFPLYAVVREPIQYLLHESAEMAGEIVKALGYEAKNAFAQLQAASDIYANPGKFEAVLTELGVSARTLKGLNFDMLGINLGARPEYNIFNSEVWKWDWPHIGAFLMPVLSAGGQVFSMIVSQKLNDSLVTNEKGIQDKETAKKAQGNQQGKVMMYTMPIMSLLIGYSFPAALSLYWFASGLMTTLIDVILTKHYRKVYDAEDASRLRIALQQEEAEMEKERIRAERRAANPDGITANTSKKKMQQNKQREQEMAKAAALKEYNAKRGIVEQEDNKGPAPMSGIAERPFCKGRAYVADRYSNETTEE